MTSQFDKREHGPDHYWPLFHHMRQEHRLTLTSSEMDEIIRIALKTNAATQESAEAHPPCTGASGPAVAAPFEQPSAIQTWTPDAGSCCALPSPCGAVNCTHPALSSIQTPTFAETLAGPCPVCKALPSAIAETTEDAERYRWLRIRGAALAGTEALEQGLVHRVGNLDEAIDNLRRADRTEADRG